MSTLIRIARLFADRKGLERGYDIKTAAGRNSTAKLRFDDIKLTKLGPNKKTTVIPPAETYTITDADLDLNLKIEHVMDHAEKCRHTVSPYAISKWIFSDKDKLHSLVERLRLYNNNLADITM